mgnify:CR=1 FL=1
MRLDDPLRILFTEGYFGSPGAPLPDDSFVVLGPDAQPVVGEVQLVTDDEEPEARRCVRTSFRKAPDDALPPTAHRVLLLRPFIAYTRFYLGRGEDTELPAGS